MGRALPAMSAAPLPHCSHSLLAPPALLEFAGGIILTVPAQAKRLQGGKAFGEASGTHQSLSLVTPRRHGFEWVKWITRVEVLTVPDPVQVLSIFTSSLTAAGPGK
jgi:hypothetical protein